MKLFIVCSCSSLLRAKPSYYSWKQRCPIGLSVSTQRFLKTGDLICFICQPNKIRKVNKNAKTSKITFRLVISHFYRFSWFCSVCFWFVSTFPKVSDSCLTFSDFSEIKNFVGLIRLIDLQLIRRRFRWAVPWCMNQIKSPVFKKRQVDTDGAPLAGRGISRKKYGKVSRHLRAHSVGTFEYY